MRQAPRPAGSVAPDHGPRHVPQRSCIGCRHTRPRSDLLRLAATPEHVRFDVHQRLPGRGAYVCPDPGCVDAAARRDGHAVRRALRGGTPEDIRTALDAVRAHVTGRPPADGTHHEEHTA